jgi:hypothetical protein
MLSPLGYDFQLWVVLLPFELQTKSLLTGMQQRLAIACPLMIAGSITKPRTKHLNNVCNRTSSLFHV